MTQLFGLNVVISAVMSRCPSAFWCSEPPANINRKTQKPSGYSARPYFSDPVHTRFPPALGTLSLPFSPGKGRAHIVSASHISGELLKHTNAPCI